MQERPVARKACEEPGAGLDEAPNDLWDDLCVYIHAEELGGGGAAVSVFGMWRVRFVAL